MADKKISQLTGATTPVAGTEVLPIVQGGSTKSVSIDNLTKGRTVNASAFDTDVAAAGVTLSGTTLAADGTDTNIDINITPKGTGEVNLTKVDIDGGAIDGTTIGGASAAAGTFTTLSATTLGAALNANSQAITNVNIDSGAIDGATIGGAATTLIGTKATGLPAEFVFRTVKLFGFGTETAALCDGGGVGGAGPETLTMPSKPFVQAGLDELNFPDLTGYKRCVRYVVKFGRLNLSVGVAKTLTFTHNANSNWSTSVTASGVGNSAYTSYITTTLKEGAGAAPISYYPGAWTIDLTINSSQYDGDLVEAVWVEYVYQRNT